jgi:predicted ATPase
VLSEAATDVIAAQQAHGLDEPWERDDCVPRVVLLQRRRQVAPLPADVNVQVFDRSPMCTLALTRFLRRPVPPLLAAEVDRILTEHVYEPRVLLVRPLGFVQATAARRIT